MSVNFSFIKEYPILKNNSESLANKFFLLGVVQKVFAIYLDSTGVVGIYSLEDERNIFTWKPDERPTKAVLNVLAKNLFCIDVHVGDILKNRCAIKSKGNKLELHVSFNQEQSSNFKPLSGGNENTILFYSKNCLIIDRNINASREVLPFKDSHFVMSGFCSTEGGSTFIFTPKAKDYGTPYIRVYPSEPQSRGLESLYLTFSNLYKLRWDLKSASVFDSKLFVLCTKKRSETHSSVRVYWCPLNFFTTARSDISSLEFYFNLQLEIPYASLKMIEILDYKDKARFSFLINSIWKGISLGSPTNLYLQVLKQDTISVELRDSCYLIWKKDAKGRGNAFTTIPYGRKVDDQSKLFSMVTKHVFNRCVWSSENIFLLQTAEVPRRYLYVDTQNKKSGWVSLSSLMSIEESLFFEQEHMYYLESSFEGSASLREYKIDKEGTSPSPLFVSGILDDSQQVTGISSRTQNKQQEFDDALKELFSELVNPSHRV